MTGPEHYREAENLVASAENAEIGTPVEGSYLGAAQVHATLALAAATALSNATVRLPDWNAWRDMAGTRPEVAS